MMSIPTSLVPVVGSGDVRRILLRSGKWAAVYRTNHNEGTTVPVFVLRNKNYGPECLQRQFRQKVTAARSRMDVRECSWEEWRDQGVRCDRETLRRRGVQTRRHPMLRQSNRERIAAAARAVPKLRIHACFYRQDIAAYVAHICIGNVCEGLMAHRVDTRHDDTERGAAHLLFFEFARDMIQRSDIGEICIGRQSIPANETLARFKFDAGFEAGPCHLGIRLHPAAAVLLENRVSAAVLQTVRRRLAGQVPIFKNLEVLERASLRGRE